MTQPHVTLLGPQRRPTVDQVVQRLHIEGHLATVTAGWQEREPDDGELHSLLDGRSLNLGLYGRWLDVQERDPEFAAADLEHRAILDELRLLHLVQLESALGALNALARRSGDSPAAIETAISDAEAVVQLIDLRHVDRIRIANDEFSDAYSLDERAVIAEHRQDVRGILEEAGALVVAGGHIGVLLRVLKLFQVAASVPPVIVAWSAGAMSLTERAVLFHDRTPQGPAPAEIFDNGLALINQVVLLPDARRRLLVDDYSRMASLARRFAPATAVVLDEGDELELTPDGGLPPDARVIGADGRIQSGEVAA